MKFKLFCFILSLGFISCQNWQYDVRVYNNTGESITLKYKTENSVLGIAEQSVIIPHGETKVVLKSKDIPKGQLAQSECGAVAQYFDAYLRNEVKSNVQWCDERFRLEHVDLGQKQFFIEYTKVDFDI